MRTVSLTRLGERDRHGARGRRDDATRTKAFHRATHDARWVTVVRRCGGEARARRSRSCISDDADVTTRVRGRRSPRVDERTQSEGDASSSRSSRRCVHARASAPVARDAVIDSMGTGAARRVLASSRARRRRRRHRRRRHRHRHRRRRRRREEGCRFGSSGVDEDLARVTTMEQASYPADEAASAMRLEMRQREAGEFFMVARAVDSMDSSVLEDARVRTRPGRRRPNARRSTPTRDPSSGTCAVRSPRETFWMNPRCLPNDPSGDVLAIHSVCVDERFHRRGVAASPRWRTTSPDGSSTTTLDAKTTTTTTTPPPHPQRFDACVYCAKRISYRFTSDTAGSRSRAQRRRPRRGAETWFDMVLDLA